VRNLSLPVITAKREISGNVFALTRGTFEVKDPSVPLSRIEDLKKLYRIIANDERSTAVLKPVASASGKKLSTKNIRKYDLCLGSLRC